MTVPEVSAAGRPPLRLISIAWGRTYVQEFLEFCLPALLSPGNLPALAEHFDVELVFLTERESFVQVTSSAVYERASCICRIRLVALNDLVATRGSYGMSLTYAFFRGFEDLGPAMTDTYMVFIHADFILAEGSYRRLIPHLLRGERLVLAPSYCVIAEEVRPRLSVATESGGTILSMPPRVMADLVINHRHFTVRGKTVNQRFFSLKYIEQFYWMANETTMLAHQLPIAVVAMKPERHLTDMTSYWDYGIIQEFCPSMRFTVLGDSDEFLMLELRGRDTAKQDLEPGWPTPKNIAQVLATFITDYKRVIGRARLTVHSQDLPPDIEAAHVSLDRFVAAVYEHLPEKLLHQLEHPQWTHHFTTFHAARDAYLNGATGQGSPEADAGLGTARRVRTTVEAETEGVPRSRLDALINELIAESRRHLPTEPARTLANSLAALSGYAVQAARCEAALAAVSVRPHHGPDAGANAKSASVAAGAARQLAQEAQEAQRALEQLQLSTQQFLLSQHAWHAGVTEKVRAAGRIAEIPAQMSIPVGADPLQTLGNLRLRRVSRALFGAAPEYRPWHWLSASTRLAVGAVLDFAAPGKRVLLINRGYGQSWHLEQRGLTIVSVPIDVLDTRGMLAFCIDQSQPFDGCIIEAEIDALKKFRAAYEEVRPLLRPGGRLIALFLNAGGVSVPVRDPDFLRAAFPPCGPARIAYSGSFPAAVAGRVRRATERWLFQRVKVGQGLAIGASLIAAAPFAWLASLVESARTLDNAEMPPPHISSVTIDCAVG